MINLLPVLLMAFSSLQIQSNQAMLQNALDASKPIQSETCLAKTLRPYELFDFEGSQLNILIYGPVKNAIEDARLSGHNIAISSSYRNCVQQSNLRSSNCLSITAPAEQCSPPTEQAGSSLHNYGMAVDLKCVGYLSFGASPCYAWLKQNATTYDLVQRPSEPWHWSLTGK